MGIIITCWVKGWVFVPVIDGADGGFLLRKKEDSYSSVVGTKGYRWKESEIVKACGNEDQIALSYFYRLMDEAIMSIKMYGPIEDFVDNYHELESDIGLIGFDDIPPILAVANATILKGD